MSKPSFEKETFSEEETAALKHALGTAHGLARDTLSNSSC